jgi:hypothetical protein
MRGAVDAVSNHLRLLVTKGGAMMAEKRNRHRRNALKARIAVRGLSAIDMRTAAAQALVAWTRELVSALGGQENITPQKSCLIDGIVRSKLYLDNLDAYLMSQASLINRRRRAALPALAQRNALLESLARLLRDLGLERQARPIPSLQEFIAEHDAAKEEAAP